MGVFCVQHTPCVRDDVCSDSLIALHCTGEAVARVAFAAVVLSVL